MGALAAAGGFRSVVQFITVVVIFLGVLLLTGAVTRWMASFQKSREQNTNIQVIETASLGNGKLVQIVRLGETYVALVQGKDSVTVIRELRADELAAPSAQSPSPVFGELLRAASEQVARRTGHSKGNKNETE